MVLVAIAAVLCVGELMQPAMATAGGHDCFGPACQDQISCGPPAQPPASSGFSVHVVARLATVEAGPALERTETPAIGPPLARLAWHPVAPFAPRSPPAA
jgi:hypothetical protein